MINFILSLKYAQNSSKINRPYSNSAIESLSQLQQRNTSYNIQSSHTVKPGTLNSNLKYENSKSNAKSKTGSRISKLFLKNMK